MTVMNGIDRFHLAMAAARHLPDLGEAGIRLSDTCREKLREHAACVREHGEDLPEIRNWNWPYKSAAEAGY
jgi:xylulose-5-phosphate/fructose-6-phosphate phosphoketolase